MMRRLLIFTALVAGGVSISACATSQHQSDAELQQAAGELEKLAAELEAQMSEEERAVFHREVEQSVIAEMQARAAICGTRLHFTNEPRFEDRTVFVDRSATDEQRACIQKSYPFAKAQPE